MRASPYGFEIVEDCTTCTIRDERFFCSLERTALQAFDQVSMATVYPSGSILYVEGQQSRGVFMLCRGRAKMSIAARDGKTLITRVALAGEILGVSCALSESAYQSTVETIEPSQVKFVKRDEFIRFMKQHAEACYRVAEQLTREVHESNDHIRSLGLSHSASEKLAHLILSWCDESGRKSEDGMRVKVLITHNEISQLIGTSRETVTRILGELKEKGIISIKGSTMTVHNKPALEAIVLL